MKALLRLNIGSCQNAVLDLGKVVVQSFGKWTFQQYLQHLKPKYGPIYGAYLELQYAKRRRLLKPKTVVVILPKFILFGIGFGVTVIGAHFDSKKVIRDFRSKKTKLLQNDPHVIKYNDLTTQGPDRFPCNGVIWFRARQDEKYLAATGNISIPRSPNGQNGVHQIGFKWNRISEADIEAAIGRSEMEGLEDILDFIWSKWKVR